MNSFETRHNGINDKHAAETTRRRLHAPLTIRICQESARMSNMLHSYLSLHSGRVELWLLNQRLNNKLLAMIMCVWVDQVSIGYK